MDFLHVTKLSSKPCLSELFCWWWQELANTGEGFPSCLSTSENSQPLSSTAEPVDTKDQLHSLPKGPQGFPIILVLQGLAIAVLSSCIPPPVHSSFSSSGSTAQTFSLSLLSTQRSSSSRTSAAADCQQQTPPFLFVGRVLDSIPFA